MGLEFNTSLSGLMSAQKLIRVAQNNISNINTEGYARQRAEIAVNSVPAGQGIKAELGTGVVTEQITRLKDDMLIQQSRNEMSQVGYFKGLREVLTNLESIYDETAENSVSDQLQGFFNAWEESSKFPQEASYRSSLLGTAERLTHKLNSMGDEIEEVKKQTDVKIEKDLMTVNELIRSIASVNEKISSYTTDNPNALLDERDRYINQLSNFVDVKVTTSDRSGEIDIKVGGATVVSGKHSKEIKGWFLPTKQEWLLSASDVELKIDKGSMAGYLEVRNGVIQKHEGKLDVLVKGLINEVNTLHNTGFGLDGTTGVNFFQGVDYRSIEVNALLKNNNEKIALANVSTAPGNSDIGKAMRDLENKQFLSGGTADPISFYQGNIVDMATELNVVRDNEDVHTNVLRGINIQKEAIQGVNIDEEMTNMLNYQQFYQANAKMVSSITKMNDVMMSMV